MEGIRINRTPSILCIQIQHPGSQHSHYPIAVAVQDIVQPSIKISPVGHLDRRMQDRQELGTQSQMSW